MKDWLELFKDPEFKRGLIEYLEITLGLVNLYVIVGMFVIAPLYMLAVIAGWI